LGRPETGAATAGQGQKAAANPALALPVRRAVLPGSRLLKLKLRS